MVEPYSQGNGAWLYGTPGRDCDISTTTGFCITLGGRDARVLPPVLTSSPQCVVCLYRRPHSANILLTRESPDPFATDRRVMRGLIGDVDDVMFMSNCAPNGPDIFGTPGYGSPFKHCARCVCASDYWDRGR